MKKAIVSYGFIMFNFTNAFADNGFDQLKQSFAGLIQSSSKEFDRAATLKPDLSFAQFANGTEISKSECENIKNKIRPNYKVDPFHAGSENWISEYSLCDDHFPRFRTFVPNGSKKTNLGLSYEFVLQQERKGPEDIFGREQIENIFIDSTYRMVEIQKLEFYPGTHEIRAYDISSLDMNGNILNTALLKGWHGPNDTLTTYAFVTPDGSMPLPVEYWNFTHPTDSSKNFQSFSYIRADKKDWDSFALPITFTWTRGFYSYGNQIRRFPKFESQLMITYREGKELCAIGSIGVDQKLTVFPSDSDARYWCFERWGGWE